MSKMRVQQDAKHKQIVIHKGSLRIKMSDEEFTRRVQGAADWYTGKSKEFDKYHGNSATMFDPEAPFPKSFNPRVTPRDCGNGSHSKNGKCTGTKDVLSYALRKRVK
jgi:hypothetical protein